MQQMLENLRARHEDERGFTLIELMVVVLIIAILIAIAIPTFLGAKQRAQDKAAQSSLRNALTNAKGIYTDSDSYSGATTTALAAAEPSLSFTTGTSTGAKNVSVASNATTIVMAAKSASGTCYVIGDVATGPGTIFENIGQNTCTTSGMT
ncbi:MAG: prepilin-type N-terminal cleavage/methylation domain-containing protein, partial [Acidimicrobiia bacterium]